MLFTWLWVHLLDKGLRVTVTAVDSLNDAILMHWNGLPCPQITNLGSTNLLHFINACFPWIVTMKWSLCFCRNQMMGLINYWSEVTHGWILLHYTMILRRDQRRIPGLCTATWRRTKRLTTSDLFPEIIRLIYWVKVNSSMIMFTDHCWSIPFHDKCF